MKKFIFSFICVFMMACGLASCGGYTNSETSMEDSTEVVEDSTINTDSVVTVDTAAVDTVSADSVA